MHRELLARYTRACDEEANSKNFRFWRRVLTKLPILLTMTRLKPCGSVTQTIL